MNIDWVTIILIIIGIILLVRIKRRGYFWLDRYGNKLSLREFFKSWGDGISGTTPLQQTKITMWGFPFMVVGIWTGIVITIINKTWWMTLILGGSMPIVSMQILSTWQKFKQMQRIDKTMKELNKKNEKTK